MNIMNNIEVPGKYDLFDFSGIPSFANSKKGQELIKQYNDAKQACESNLKNLNYGKWGMIVVGIFTIPYGIGIVLLILAYFMRKKGYFANNIRQTLTDAQNAYNNAYYAYIDEIIAALTEKYAMPNWRSYRHDNQAIIYNNDGFMYFEVDNGLLIIYGKDDIKEVSRERVHTGSHTTQNSNTYGGATRISDTSLFVGGANTTTNADTSNFYEWHFDILTDFISHPKVSFVLPDSPQVEDFVGEAYAILKP